MGWVKEFINPYVISYLLLIAFTQAVFVYHSYAKRLNIKKRRHAQGLPENIIMAHSERLEDIRREGLTQAIVLLAAVFLIPILMLSPLKPAIAIVVVIVPMIIVTLAWLYVNDASHSAAPLLLLLTLLTLMVISMSQGIRPMTEEERKALTITFIVLLAWVFYNATTMVKAFLGGLAFKTLVAFKSPFQVGDRVTFKGYSGKVKELGMFFVKLQTLNDDLVSIPTTSLWSETLVSSNAGEQSSMCVLQFYLAPYSTIQKCQEIEDAIWDSVQASPYYEFRQPMQIYYSQKENAICLTAKAYVASTYNEPLFKSDVTRMVLKFASDHHVPLAATKQKVDLKVEAGH